MRLMMKSHGRLWSMAAVLASAMFVPLAYGSSAAKPADKPAAHGAAAGGHESPPAANKPAPKLAAPPTSHAPSKEPQGSGIPGLGAPVQPNSPAGAPAHEDTGGQAASGTNTPDQILVALKQGNAHFLANKLEHPHSDSRRRADTAEKGQKPLVTVISCSDSRVPVELILDRGVGDLFVIRVAGNVCNNDEIGSAEYGVGHLGTPLLLVLGHTKCGAVTAVAEGSELHGHIAPLVANIKPAIEAAHKAHPEAKGTEIVSYAIETNVWRSIEDLLTGSETLAEQVKSGHLRVEGAIYDIATGQINWLGGHPRQQELLSAAKGHAANSHEPSPQTQPSNAQVAAQPPAPQARPAPDTGGQAASGTRPPNTGGQAASGTRPPDTGGQPASGTAMREQVAGFRPARPPGVLERCMAEEVYRQGATHLAAGEYDRAADRFEAASQMDPTMLVARNDLAGVYYLQQDYGKALSIYASILADDPHHANALRGAALCHATQRHYDQSRDMLQKVLDMNRHDARSWLDLGDVNFLAGDTHAAQESWKTAAQATHDPEIASQAQIRLKAYPTKSAATSAASQPALASH